MKDLWARIQEFVKEVKAELGKVTWPSREETVASTLVTVLVVFVVAAFIGLNDLVYRKLLELVFRRG